MTTCNYKYKKRSPFTAGTCKKNAELTAGDRKQNIDQHNTNNLLISMYLLSSGCATSFRDDCTAHSFVLCLLYRLATVISPFFCPLVTYWWSSLWNLHVQCPHVSRLHKMMWELLLCDERGGRVNSTCFSFPLLRSLPTQFITEMEPCDWSCCRRAASRPSVQ